jgi:arabinofuranosyltransferase
MGKWGYSLDRNVKVVDGFAIVDPLLARLPMMGDRIATMGMTTRAIPQGYMEAVATGSTAQMDPDLAAYYEKLRIVVSGDVWSAARLKEVLYFNLGVYDNLLEKYNSKAK